MSLGNRFSYPETEEKSITIQNPKQALLLIDSDDRYPFNADGTYNVASENGTYNNYIINHQKLNGFGQIKRIGVSEVLFPWLTPNVNIRNNIFVLAGGVENPFQSYYCKVNEGFYTAQTISDPSGSPGTGPLSFQLNNFLKNTGTNTASTFGAGTWTTTYNVDGTITIANASVSWIPASVPLALLPTLNISSYLNSLVGAKISIFEDITTAKVANSFKGGYPPMTYTSYIDICSNALCNFQKLKDTLTQFNYTNIICRLYLTSPSNISNQPFGTSPCPSFSKEFQNVKWIEWNSNQMIGQIDIQYRDDQGLPLYIPDSVDTAQFISVLMSDS
jgi:hypothetical protein